MILPSQIGISFLLQKGITVVPVVGILWDRNAFKPVINTAEVAAIFDAPLEMFLKVSKSKNSLLLYRFRLQLFLPVYWLILG